MLLPGAREDAHTLHYRSHRCQCSLKCRRRSLQDQYNGEHGRLFAGCARLVAQRHSHCPPNDNEELELQLFRLLWANDHGIASAHILDLSTMPEAQYKEHLKELHTWLVTPSYAGLTSEAFKTKFCSTLLSGYCQAELTSEQDRDQAVTSVARHLLSVQFRDGCADARQLMRCMWNTKCRQLESESSTRLFQIPALNPAMLGGCQALGLGKVCGSRLRWQGQKVHYLAAQVQTAHELEVLPWSFDDLVHLLKSVDAASTAGADQGVVGSYSRGPVDLYLCDTELGDRFVVFVAVAAQVSGATNLQPLGLTLHYTGTDAWARPRAEVVFQ